MAKGKYEKWLEPESLILLEGWARDGLTDEQIANNMGIRRETLYDWKKKYPNISNALKKGKEVVNIEVENALLKRALGYEYAEITRERIVDSGQKKRHGGESRLTEREWEMAKVYFGEKCCYCGSTVALTKDHLQPLNDNGTMTVDNIVPACQKCNSSKKDEHWLSWYQKQDFYSTERAKKISEYIAFACGMKTVTTDGDLVITKMVTKHVAPDTTALIFWLKNRMPDKWRDKQQMEHSGGIGVDNPFEGLTTKELRKLAEEVQPPD